MDNTFATPFAVRPLELGADVVVESATKFLSGHSDLIAGAVMSDVDTLREVQRRVVTFGGCLDPAAAYLLWRGLQTFEVRLARQTGSAARLADALAARDDVPAVVHPTRPDHPQHELAAAMMPRGYRDADHRGGSAATGGRWPCCGSCGCSPRRPAWAGWRAWPARRSTPRTSRCPPPTGLRPGSGRARCGSRSAWSDPEALLADLAGRAGRHGGDPA